jgi:His-Xaa-Ser system protein HxsD
MREARTEVDLRAYDLSAVKKAAYRMADRVTVILSDVGSDRVSLAFQFKSDISEIHAREIVRLFFQELLDQDLRAIVARETEPFRALILAQAFSKTDLIRRE